MKQILLATALACTAVVSNAQAPYPQYLVDRSTREAICAVTRSPRDVLLCRIKPPMTAQEMEAVPDDVIDRHFAKQEKTTQQIEKIEQLFDGRYLEAELNSDVIGFPFVFIYLKNMTNNDYKLMKDNKIAGEIVLMNSKYSKKEARDLQIEILHTLRQNPKSIKEMSVLFYNSGAGKFELTVSVGATRVIKETLAKNKSLPLNEIQIIESPQKMVPAIKMEPLPSQALPQRQQ